jgi:EAL domain-containing protein (putative c-di-GMP-specific phosphodiesterase class I)/FixJ family two-component response regulator
MANRSRTGEAGLKAEEVPMQIKPGILIAEDDDDLRSWLIEQALGFYFSVKEASGEDLLELMYTYTPDVLVLDLQLTDVDAIQIIRWLSENPARPLLILMSGQDAKVIEAVRQFAIANGWEVVGILSKPFRAPAFRRLLGKAKARVAPKPNYQDQSLLSQLVIGIPNNELVLFYQPLVSVSDDTIKGVEGLVRWNHPIYGHLGPERFIAMAEKSGAIVPLTWWVLRTAIKQHSLWKEAGRVLSVSVNISAKFLVSPKAVDVVLRLLRNHDCEPRYLTLEITETEVTGNSTVALEILARFRLAGVKVAMDDYGVGFSTLSQLERYPFSDLKLDRWIVTAMPTDKRQRDAISNLVKLVGKQGMTVTGEGVETGDQLAALAEAGVQKAQGFLFACAMPAEQIDDWISNTVKSGRFRMIEPV